MMNTNKYKRWTKEEIDFVINNYKDMTGKEIAKKLKRTSEAIMGIKNKLKLRKEEKWSKNKVKTKLKTIAKRLNHSPSVREVLPTLYQACLRYFGSFNNAKKSSGLSINKQKYNVIKENAHKLSKELAYIFGVDNGDGHTYIRRSKRRTSAGIMLGVKDKDFAIYFKDILERWSGIKASFHFYKRGDRFITNLYSIEAAKIIKNFDINKILLTNKDIKCSFLQGLFDSEGGVTGVNLDRRRYAGRWIHFSNNNKGIINIVSSILNQFNIKHTVKSRIHSGFGSKKLQYEIIIYGFYNLLWFYNNINFNIKRKKDKLKEVLDSYTHYKRENLIKEYPIRS